MNKIEVNIINRMNIGEVIVYLPAIWCKNPSRVPIPERWWHDHLRKRVVTASVILQMHPDHQYKLIMR